MQPCLCGSCCVCSCSEPARYVRKVKSKAFHRMGFLLQWEFEDAPARFGWPHVPAVKVHGYFVKLELYIRPVMTFVSVQVQVFDSNNACTILDIDVAIVFLREVGVVRHNVSVVNWLLALHVDRPAATTVDWITEALHSKKETQYKGLGEVVMRGTRKKFASCSECPL